MIWLPIISDSSLQSLPLSCEFLLYKKIQTFIRSKPSKTLTFLIIILSGDIDVKPGPTSIYSCGCCELPVT